MNLSVYCKVYAAIFVASTLLLLIVGVAQAASLGSWAWGGTSSLDGAYQGIGWLHVADTGYGVQMPDYDGQLSGYAWSEHYGWVSFNAADVVNCPSSGPSGAGTCPARREGDVLKGWARILSIRDAGASGNAGGWTGWISLSKTNMNSGPDYGVTVGPGVLEGYAWSDELGYIDMKRITFPVYLTVCKEGVKLAEGASGAGTSLGRTIVQTAVDYIDVYYDSTPDCSGTNVARKAGIITDADTNAYSPITLTNPSVPAESKRVFGKAIGTEGVTITYKGLTVVIHYTVTEPALQ